jgi:acyl-CoA reductase-like NAD-dependent aldehyde dehydrogenase
MCYVQLGGKAPVIILPDADLSVAANNGKLLGHFDLTFLSLPNTFHLAIVLFHSTLNAGQICMSTERILVPDHLVEQFTNALQKAASKSDRFSQDSHEALYSSASAHRISAMVDEAVRQGARVLLGGTSTSGDLNSVLDQAKYPITILGDVTRDMTIWKEETFGPLAIVVSVQPKDDGEASVDDALVLAANDSSYGLAASIFSNDIGRALKIARRLETGMIRINAGTVGDDPTVVFG